MTPHARLVWTKEESADGAVAFEEKDRNTRLALHKIYRSKEAHDDAIIGMQGGMPQQFEQLDELLVNLGASTGRS